MKQLDINHFQYIVAEYRRIQASYPDDIELYDGIQRVKLDPKLIEEWKFIGLGCVGFVEEVISRGLQYE